MGVRFHRRTKSRNGGHWNISGSGISHSQKIGKFTFNSRGTMTFNSSVKGLSYKFPTLVGIFVFIPLYYGYKFFVYLVFKLPFRFLKYLFNSAKGLLINKKETN